MLTKGKGIKSIKPIVYLLTIFLLLSGCTYPSDALLFPHDTTVAIDGQTPEQNPAAMLKIALATNNHAKNAERFWYTGWIANNIEKRRVTSMYSGAMIRPHGYILDGRLAGVPFRYYRWDDHLYIWTEKNDWSAVQEEMEPFDPFYGFTWWEPYVEQAVQLPNEKVLSKDSLVYQITLNGKEWITNGSNPIFEQLQRTFDQRLDLQKILEQTRVEMKIWIGDETYTKEEVAALAKDKGADLNQLEQWIQANYFIWDEEAQVYRQHLINQYQTLIQMPIPAAGYMDQEIFFRFYKYDDPGIEIAAPEEIQRYIDLKNNED